MQNSDFDVTTPKAAKEKLRAAVPTGANVVLYKTYDDFNAVVFGNKELDWIKQELKALPLTQ